MKKKDSISNYHTERHLYDARASHVHVSRQSDATQEPVGSPLEQQLLQRLLANKGVILRVIGLGLRYFVIGLFYPFYLIYLVAKWCGGWIKMFLDLCKRGLEYVNQQLARGIAAVQSGIQRVWRVLSENAFSNALKKAYHTIRSFKLPIERWQASFQNISQQIKNVPNALWRGVLSPFTAINSFFNRLGNKINTYSISRYSAMKSFTQKVAENISQRINALRQLMATVKGRMVRFGHSLYQFPGNTRAKLLALLQRLKEKAQLRWQSFQEQMNAIGKKLVSPFHSLRNWIRSIIEQLSKIKATLKERIAKMDELLTHPAKRMARASKHGKERLTQMSQAAAATAKEKVGEPMHRMANALKPSSETVEAIKNKGRFGIGSLKQSVNRVKELSKSANQKMGQAVSKPVSTIHSSIRKRFQVVVAWARVIPRYLMQRLDEVYFELRKWVEPPK